ncbi:hypothetical protein ACQ5JZ_32745, partial [Streptomyces sp. ZG43]
MTSVTGSSGRQIPDGRRSSYDEAALGAGGTPSPDARPEPTLTPRHAIRTRGGPVRTVVRGRRSSGA